MIEEVSNVAPPSPSHVTGVEERRYTAEAVDGTRREVVRRQVEASTPYDAVRNVLDRTPDVDLAPGADVERLERAGEAVGHRVTYQTESDRASELVATQFDDADDPLVSVAIEGGDGGPVRYYYRADADSVAGDDRNVSVQRERLADYTSDKPTTDGSLPTPKQVTADLRLLEDEAPRVGESATVSAIRSEATGTDDSGDPVRIVGYEWDLDGDGTFEYGPADDDSGGNLGQDTLELPLGTGQTYDEAGTETVQVRVYGSNDQSDVATLEFDVVSNDPPQAAIRQVEVPETIRMQKPGLFRFTAADTEPTENVEAFEWNFAHESGDNSGKVDGGPNDSIRTVERPSDGWADWELEQDYQYEIEGTYAIQLKAIGENTTTVATTQLEVTDTKQPHFRGNIVNEELPPEQKTRVNEGKDRYVVQDPEYLTQSGWEPYTGTFEWSVEAQTVKTGTSGSYFFDPDPTRPTNVRLSIEMERGDRSGIISTTIENDGNPLRVRIDAVTQQDDNVDSYQAVVEYYSDDSWGEVRADSYQWFDQYEKPIATGSVIDSNVTPGFSVEVTYGEYTATAADDADVPTPDMVTEVNPKLERKLPEAELVERMNSARGATDGMDSDHGPNAVDEAGAGIAYHDGMQTVPPEEDVTFTTERSWDPEGKINGYRWILTMSVYDPEVDNDTYGNGTVLIKRETGETFTHSFRPSRTTVELPELGEEGDVTTETIGRYHLQLEVVTDEGSEYMFTSVYVKDLTDDSNLVGYDSNAVVSRPTSAAPIVSADDAPNVDVDVDATTTQSVATSAELVDPRHPGPSQIWER